MFLLLSTLGLIIFDKDNEKGIAFMNESGALSRASQTFVCETC
jgi:hypothetical protein